MNTMDRSMKSRPVFRVDHSTPRAAAPTKPSVEQGGDDGRREHHVLVYTCSVRQRHERAEDG
jgi:hypothetical protein